jgi:hypothetical protein
MIQTGNLEYIDETADWTRHYAQGVQSDTGSDDGTQDEAPPDPIHTSSFRSSGGHGGATRPVHTGQIGPPSPAQVIPRSSDVFEYPSKRRKTDEAMPSIARSNSHNHDSPSTDFSIPLQSPNFSLSDLQLGSRPFDGSPRAHGGPQSLEFASSLGAFRISNHGQPHDAQSTTTGVNHFDAVNEDIPHSADNQYNLLSPRLWTQQSVWPCPTLQEACLMRYFVEKLAHWVSLHFSLIRADATTIRRTKSFITCLSKYPTKSIMQKSMY